MSMSVRRFVRLGLPLGVVAAAIAGLVFAGLVVADEVGKAGMPAPQKPVTAPLFEGSLGSWTTASTHVHEGKETKSTGRSTFEKEIGGTAIVQTYESTGPGPDGKTTTYHGHGVYKVSDDGKSATLWWFCNMSPDVLKLTGSITDDALDLSGPSPMGTGTFQLSVRKSASGLDVQIKDGATEMKETYTKSR